MDREFWEALLDEAPGDALTRLAYADWLREAGLTADATVQEWLGRAGRHPYISTVGFGYGRSCWGWVCHSAHPLRAHATLPSVVSHALNMRHYPYSTRAAAERALTPYANLFADELRRHYA